ncbi:hypothetical protein D1867_12165 [Acidianus infernus]|uniref:Uncharacterized protein n=1 Tax=Acidianus infernus TaxID=12915 RepID=A0A6A9QI23_ACIIN|nr:hypothetical protein [Acidianus infernus]MUM65965.1 hypothetical protein [Acidianus infernus]
MQDINVLNDILKQENIPVDITPVYLSWIFFHELTHHVLEDMRVSTYLDLGTSGKIYDTEDEKLCEYAAFILTGQLVEKCLISSIDFNKNSNKISFSYLYNNPNIIDSNGYILGYPLPGFFLEHPLNQNYQIDAKNLRKYIHDMLALLYYYYHLDKDPMYNPEVPDWVDPKLFTQYLAQNLSVVLDSAWSPKHLPSVYTRVFYI